MSEGFGFLGFRIQWHRKRGGDKWHVYTFIADRPIRQLKDKIRALTNTALRADSTGTPVARASRTSLISPWLWFRLPPVARCNSVRITRSGPSRPSGPSGAGSSKRWCRSGRP